MEVEDTPFAIPIVFKGQHALSDRLSALLQVTEETEELRFNTGISALMEFVNAAFKWEQVPKQILEPFVLMLGPYAPHLAEELWQVLPNSLKISFLVLSSGVSVEYTIGQESCCL